jgi:CheY-like chemotaxis protein
MVRILLVGMGSDKFTRIVKALRETGSVKLDHADSGGSALSGLMNKPADLVVASEKLSDMSGLTFAAKLVVQNPVVNCALVSSLGDKAFHEASEGLGILAKLPPDLDETHVVELLKKLKIVIGPGK